MKFIQSLVSLALATAAVASPTPTTLDKRATTICGQYDTVQTGAFTIYGNKWGIKGYTGNQCTTVNGLSVKSYANAGLNFAHRKVSAIKSIPASWKWSYTGSNIVADVSWDLFSSAAGTGNADYEIMIWTGALGGAGPISKTGSTIATPTIAGVSWKLYFGPNGDTKVFSFVASSPVENFFCQILTTIQAGTEPFTGSNAVFTTSAYSVAIN
ncbi:hypothetical protein DID88_008330 [Monilinia fructigena]|uniref:Uncharacterized protein n=1 Tax=Monilinia fructigena TaxID=38457 RepID=A0A395J4Y9_9HELO|nr:hypothetical protein DID88_008330 [Monilinia fructigena]